MWRILAIFFTSMVLSLILHFSMAGNSNIIFDQITISVNLKDLLFGGLLLTNLIVVILLLRKKHN